jgi:hypothetical protein
MSLASKVVDFLCLASEQPDLIIYSKRKKIKIRGLLSEKRKKKKSVCELIHFYTNQILQQKKLVSKEEIIEHLNKHTPITWG